MQEPVASHAEAASQASIGGVLKVEILVGKTASPTSCFSHVTFYTKQAELYMPEPLNSKP